MAERKFSDKVIAGIAGNAIAGYVKFVRLTSSFQDEPAGFIEKHLPDTPLIIAMWHGQGLLLPYLKPNGDVKVSVVVARHIDGDIADQSLKHFGMTTIRGAGAGRKGKDKGGVAALRACITAIREGTTVALTADLPPGPARKAGPGLPTLAKLTGRSILPCAVVTKNYFRLNTWSGFTVMLPFSKIVMAGGEQIKVPRNLSDEGLKAVCKQLEDAMNEVTDRAYRTAGTCERGIPNDDDPVAYGFRLRSYVRMTRWLQPLATSLLKYRQRQGKEDAARLNERLGLPSGARARGPLVWVHAASVGETLSVLGLIDKLLADRRDLSIVLTTGTVTSAELAGRRLPAERVVHQYVPLDAPDFVSSFFDHWKPDTLILTESEIWPNVIREARLRKIPIVLINGRMSERSFRRWRKRYSVARQLFGKLDLVLAQTDRYAVHFERLGARNVDVSGNLKTDATPLPIDQTSLRRLKRSIGKRPVFLAASTHKGEEELVARTHEALASEIPDLLTIIAPRHPDRGPEVAAMLRNRGIDFTTRSRGELPARASIYIADTIGELGQFFSLSSVSFIGGSLVRHGGQNPIEPIMQGSLVIVGPHVHNFEEAYAELVGAGGCISIEDPNELAGQVSRYLKDEDARTAANKQAIQTVESMQGALDRTVDALQDFLPKKHE